ncbi:MAG TPA: ABC transporter permease [Urbifossiella sp.]|jgi:ribose transport system permease protein|nr:ABC transporter permease [Urbifossiella sp.]
MMRILGVLGLLVALYAGAIGTTYQNAVTGEPASKTWERTQNNLFNVSSFQGRYGVITLGAALVIITGGIDLSIGSVVGCAAVLFGVLTREGVHPFAALPLVVLAGALVGLGNGLLITRLRLQPFLVTLCGMFVYRGVARLLIGTEVSRSLTVESQPEFAAAIGSLRYVLVGKNASNELVFPAQFVLLLVLAAVVGFFLHRTAYGRYWYAIGHNELAAKYAGVNVDRQRVWVYMACSALAALAGVLSFLDLSSISPESGGQYLELYAILGAVLGGCSLRGGEGTAVGMVLGAMVLPVLENLVSTQGLKSNMIPAVIGLTLLLGTIVDEFIRRRSRAVH